MEFVEPYYKEKDIMHNMWHIELVKKQMDKILSVNHYEVDYKSLLLAMYFHGFIYKEEQKIRAWLDEQNYDEEQIKKIVQIAWESQRSEVPETIPLCEEMNAYTNKFFRELIDDIFLD